MLDKVPNGKREDLPLKGAGRTHGKQTRVPAGQGSTLRVTAGRSVPAIDVTATALEHTKEKIMQRQKLACLGLVLSMLALFGEVALAQQPEEQIPLRSAPLRPPRAAPLTEAESAALPQTESLRLSPEQTAIPLGAYTAVVQ